MQTSTAHARKRPITARALMAALLLTALAIVPAQAGAPVPDIVAGGSHLGVVSGPGLEVIYECHAAVPHAASWTSIDCTLYGHRVGDWRTLDTTSEQSTGPAAVVSNRTFVGFLYGEFRVCWVATSEVLDQPRTTTGCDPAA